MKIKYRFLLVFVLVTVVTGGILVVAFDTYQSHLRTDVSETTERNAQRAATFLDSRLLNHQRTVETAAINPTLRAHGTPDQQEALDSFVAASEFSGASIVDADGRMIMITGVTNESRETVLGEAFIDRPYVQRALEGETYISDPFMADTGNQIVVISTPLVADNGTVIGTINAAYNLDETTLFEPLRTDDDRIGVTVSVGNTVLHTTADGFANSATETASLSSANWVVTSHYDASAIRQDFRRLAVGYLLASVLLIGTISGFGIWIYQSEIQQTERLHRRIDNLEARTYDDDIEFSGATEWQEIGTALDRLSTTLARREQMLLVLNRFLRHNLRNELNVAMGYAADIKRRATSSEAHQRAETVESAINEVLSTANRVRLTEKLIDPAALDGQSIDLVAVLTERIEQVTADTPALTVTLDAPDEILVRGGETLAFAIEELIENVATHSTPHPVARITVRSTDGTVMLRIADNGPGIHPDEAAVITGTTEITPLQHSSGLGLWLVNWIVRRHDGTLSIPDTDTGTTIEIVLLRADGGP